MSCGHQCAVQLQSTRPAHLAALGSILALGAGAAAMLLGGCASTSTQAKDSRDGRPAAPLQATAERVRPKSSAAKRPATELLDEGLQNPVSMAMASDRASDDTLDESPAMARAARGLEQMLRTGQNASGLTGTDVTEQPVARATRAAMLDDAGQNLPRPATRSRLRPPPIDLPTLIPPPAVIAEASPNATLNPNVEVGQDALSIDGEASAPATGQTASVVFAPAMRSDVATNPRTMADVAAPRAAVNSRSVAPVGGSSSQDAVLKIRHFAAASRVESFGRYTPMDLRQMTAGQPIAMLLYTELDGFAHRSPAGLPPPPEGMEAENDRGQTEWIVKVSQEVAVYGPGDVLVRAVPSQVARDVSKRRRRDHYLVQRLDLPRTLAAGEYRIKVSVKDEATGQVAESIIPMTIARGVAGR